MRKKAQKARREFDARVGQAIRSGCLAEGQSRLEACGDEAVGQWKGNGKQGGNGVRRCDYSAKNVMMTNQRRRKNKLRDSEYRGAEVTARLQFKVGECRSQSIAYFVRAGRCYVENPMAQLTAWCGGDVESPAD